MDNLDDLRAALPLPRENLPPMNSEIFGSPEALRTCLSELGINNPSKRLMKYLADRNQIFKCCSCIAVFDTETQFLEHLDDEKHRYGRHTVNKVKRDLLDRIKTSFRDSGRDHAFIPDNVKANTGNFSPEECSAWRGLHGIQGLTPAQIGTYQNIIHAEVCLVRIRRNGVFRPRNGQAP